MGESGLVFAATDRAAVRAGGSGGATAFPAASRIRPDGKFFVRDGQGLRIRGVTYGPFAPNNGGEAFPEPGRSIPERSLGQQIKCPACGQLFQCGTASPPSLTARPAAAKSPGVQETPQARAAQAVPDQTIHYRCPRCAKPLESRAHLAGTKLNCPDCGQNSTKEIVDLAFPTSLSYLLTKSPLVCRRVSG